jgi:predicted AlkP superfamily pyrophosphatase or phosphodiesterase
MGNAARETRTYALNHPEEFISKPSPKFSLVHILIPHPPFLFNEDGSPIIIDQISLAEAYTKEKYVGQVKFIQNRILTFIDALQKDGRKKVIIIQGDHGPAIQEKPDAPPSDAFLNERFRILNAYYLPESDLNRGGNEPASASSSERGDGSTVYDTITPVNSFRVVFNKYFDAKLPLLEDKLYFSPTATPFAFEDITKRVKP